MILTVELALMKSYNARCWGGGVAHGGAWPMG